MTPIGHLFASLEGQWKFSRTILNNGTVTGIATFKRSDDTTLLYREEGRWDQTAETSYQVHRNYVYHLEGGSIAVYFAERPERLFHILKFSTEKLDRATASHHCSHDLYITHYHFIDPDCFTISHTITGPKKNIKIDTKLCRS